MSKIGVNDPCPCGSGKKYKKCYQASDENCPTYLKENGAEISKKYEKNFKYVTDCLLKTTDELNQLFVKNEEGMELVPVLMQMIGIFTIVDVLGSYWYEYLGKTGKQSERFDDYLNNFCFIEKNEEYANRKYLGDTTAEQLRVLRNSIVHFYGLGKNNHFCIVPNPSKDMSNDDADRVIRDFSKLKKNLTYIQAFELKKIIVNGAIVMLEQFQSDASSAKTDIEKMQYIRSVKRINDKLREEGVAFVSREMAQKLHDKLAKTH